MVVGGIEWIDESGRVTGRHFGKIQSLEDVLDIYRVWWRRRQWVQPEVFFRRSLWDRVGPFDAGYRYAFDYAFWVRCFEAGARVASIDKVLARFRLHAAQKSTNAKGAADEIRNIVRAALQRRNGLSLAFRRRLGNQLSYDRYHAGQDYPSRHLAHALLLNPQWLLLAAVRERLRISMLGEHR